MAACTGMLLIGLWTAVKELKTIAGRLGLGGATAFQRGKPVQPAAATAAASHPTAEPEPAGHAESAPPSSAPSPPWHGEAAPRERAQDDSSLAPAAEPAPAAKPKRNLLFSSSSRKERERAQARTRSLDDRASSGTSGASTGSRSRPNRRPLRSTTPGRSRNVRGPTFHRHGAPAAHRRPLPKPAPAAAGADRYPPAGRNEEPAQVTVLKSGVVDGMAYSLYSDGSIEAQMPEGMMRFASIDELRSHLDQRP